MLKIPRCLGWRSFGFGVLTLLMVLSVSPSFAAANDAGQQFCWKDSYGRGIGKVPNKCASGYDRIGLLCYKKCPSNMKRSGFDCHSTCPNGMRDDGLYCRAAEYGRGAGYAWKPGDRLGSLDGARKRCAQSHGSCEKNGAIIYPKCRTGYRNIGCCICRPNRPNCKALGLGNRIDLSCGKKIAIGQPKTGTCGSNQQKDAGLCYKRCRSGHSGVGPVCWAEKPKGWVNCGMGAAKDSKTCAAITFGQVAAVGQMAMFIGSLGTSSAAQGAKGPAEAKKLTELQQNFNRMMDAFEAVKNTTEVQQAIKAAETAGNIQKGYNASQTAKKAVTAEDLIRAAAQIAAILDPSGVAATVAAYTYPTCSKYFGTTPSSQGSGSGQSGLPDRPGRPGGRTVTNPFIR